jgi:hypothetical protein
MKRNILFVLYLLFIPFIALSVIVLINPPATSNQIALSNPIYFEKVQFLLVLHLPALDTDLRFFLNPAGSWDGAPRLDPLRDRYLTVTESQVILHDEIPSVSPLTLYEISPNVNVPADRIDLEKGPGLTDLIININSF